MSKCTFQVAYPIALVQIKQTENSLNVSFNVHLVRISGNT